MLKIIKRNDTKDVINYQLTNEDGSKVDLTGASVNFVMGKKNKLILNNPATIVSAIDGIVEYQLKEQDTLVEGQFLGEFIVTYSNELQKTFPSNGFITIKIEQNIDTNQTNIILDMIAERQGEFTEKLDSILLQAGNIAMSAMNEYTWVATEGQLTYVMPSTANYSMSSKWFEASVDNIPLGSDLINRNTANQFTLLISSSLIKAGMTINAKWTEPMVPSTQGHFSTHQVGGQDEIDIAQLKNYQTLIATPLAETMKKIGISVLDPRFNVKADWNGITGTDDTEALRAVHDYANENKLPVFYPSVSIYLKNPTSIIKIKTDTNFGKAKFVIDESLNNKDKPRFRIDSYDDFNGSSYEIITLSATDKTAIIAKLKKKEYVISELAAYRGKYVRMRDSNDLIGVRQGANANSGWAKTDIFVVEEGGRIIGDISLDFNDITEFRVQTAEESWLTVQGGTFYLTGTDNASYTTSDYLYSGFHVRRCKTIIRDQYVGFLGTNQDVSQDASNGFYNLSSVCDIRLENIRNVPRKNETVDGTPQGTYGINGQYCMNVTFRNIRADGTTDHWGLFAPDFFKNFKVEDCEVNRIDTHFWVWNLHIKDCTVGIKGVSITGGGKLIVENTKVHGGRYLNFRTDYGAFWDGDIFISNGTLYPIAPDSDIRILEYNQVNFDHKISTPIARSIVIRDFVTDFRYVQSAFTYKNIIMYLPSHGYRTDGYRIQFPDEAIFENIRVKGANAVGYRFMSILKPHDMKAYSGKTGGLTNGLVKTNCSIRLKDIDSYLFGSVKTQESTRDEQNFSLFGHVTNDTFLSDSLYPDILIENCGKIFITLKSAISNLVVRNCTVNAMDIADGGDQRSRMLFDNCILQPDVDDSAGETRCYYVTGKLTHFTNCVFDVPKRNGVNDLVLDQGILYFHTSVRASTSNCRISEEYQTVYEVANGAIQKEYLDMISYGNYQLGTDPVSRTYYRKVGTTAQRPTGITTGFAYYDTTLLKHITWNGTVWKDGANATV